MFETLFLLFSFLKSGFRNRTEPERDNQAALGFEGSRHAGYSTSYSGFLIAFGPGRERKVSGLQHFRRRYPQCRPLVVGAEGMPLSTFFETPAELLFGA
jgi:hypothetical protein